MAFSSPALLVRPPPALPNALQSFLHLARSALRLPSRLLQQLLQLLVHAGATSCCCCGCRALLAPETRGTPVGAADGMLLVASLLLLLLLLVGVEADVTCGV